MTQLPEGLCVALRANNFLVIVVIVVIAVIVSLLDNVTERPNYEHLIVFAHLS